MRSHVSKGRRKAIYGVGLVTAVLMAVALMPLLSSAAKPAASPALSLTVVNNTSRDIKHFYFSPTNQDNWGADQLGSPIVPGGTQTVSVACSSADIKAIAEDENGCFYYRVVDCADSANWTITGDTTPDCGNK